MYGNVQAALAFFIEYKDHLMKRMKLEQSLTNPCLFFKKDNEGNSKLMALTRVDDTLIAGNGEGLKVRGRISTEVRSLTNYSRTTKKKKINCA